VHRHHSWGAVDPSFLCFVAVQLLAEFGVSVLANGMLLKEGVRVDRGQRAQRPLDLAVDLLLGVHTHAAAHRPFQRCACAWSPCAPRCGRCVRGCRWLHHNIGAVGWRSLRGLAADSMRSVPFACFGVMLPSDG
jgi:hypothetical protein